MFAVKRVTNRCMKVVRGAAVIMAFVVASVVAAISTVIAMHTENTVTTCVAVGAFAGVLSACLAPTLSDGVVILVHEGALTVTGINVIIFHYTESKSQTATVDYLFVTLASWVIIVIMRIIVSKKVLECFLMVSLDALAVLHMTVIFMEVLDIVERPFAKSMPRELVAFFITVASAGLGHCLFSMVNCQRCLWRWRYMSSRLWVVLDSIVCVAFGAVGMVVWMLVGTTGLSIWTIVVLLVAVDLSPLGRSFMSLVHETAMVTPWNRETFTIWNNGIMELMNPFLLGWVVFYPYAKAVLEVKDDIN